MNFVPDSRSYNFLESLLLPHLVLTSCEVQHLTSWWRDYSQSQVQYNEMQSQVKSLKSKSKIKSNPVGWAGIKGETELNQSQIRDPKAKSNWSPPSESTGKKCWQLLCYPSSHVCARHLPLRRAFRLRPWHAGRASHLLATTLRLRALVRACAATLGRSSIRRLVFCRRRALGSTGHNRCA